VTLGHHFDSKSRHYNKFNTSDAIARDICLPGRTVLQCLSTEILTGLWVQLKERNISCLLAGEALHLYLHVLTSNVRN
jgi:hypothetical protein